MMRTLRLLFLLVIVAGCLAMTPPVALATGPATIWVDGASRSGRCRDSATRTSVSQTNPLCTLGRGAALAEPGDTVAVRDAVYKETLIPLRSGSPTAPIRFIAVDPGNVIIDAHGRRTGIVVKDRHDVSFNGFMVTGSNNQGIWVEGSARIRLTGLQVLNNRSTGIQLRHAANVTLEKSTIAENVRGGIMELGGTVQSRYVNNVISDNGHDGQPFNGDGILLRGKGALIAGNHISNNGDHSRYEHGIYASSEAVGFVIERNSLSGNAASAIKAQGSGKVRYNRLGSGRLGLYVDKSATGGLSVYYNLVAGRFQHAVMTSTGARIRIWNNTITNYPSDDPGQHTTVFAAAATSVSIRNNLITNQGRATAVAVGSGVGRKSLFANHNWYAGTEVSRLMAWRGHSLPFARWKATTRQDARSLGLAPPTFDTDGYVVSETSWRKGGQRLGLSRDINGRPVPKTDNPDLGAFQG